MHALEVIIRRNVQAAAREDGQAVNDGQFERSKAIWAASRQGNMPVYADAYFKARQEPGQMPLRYEAR